MLRASPWAVLVCALAGCAVPPKGGFDEVTELVRRRFDLTVHWYQGGAEDTAAVATVARQLAQPLTLEAALQIALLNNRSLQASFEELGIAQADLIQAGLPKNPSLDGLIRFPGNVELGWVHDLLDLLLLPARKRLADREFAAVRLKVTQEVLDLIALVKVAFFELQGELLLSEVLASTAQAARLAHEFALRQFEAGTINELDLLMRQASYEDAKLDLFQREMAVREGRERLNRLLGVWGSATAWQIADRLPALPPAEMGLDAMESLAVATRLDLAAARIESERLADALDVEEAWRWVPLAEAGVSAEREPEGTWRVGPSLSLELPLFDQGQAKVAVLLSELRRSQRLEEALVVDIHAEVGDARNKLVASRQQAEHYLGTVIPLHEQIVLKSQEHYNFMLIGLYQLLEAKSGELDAYTHYVEALRDYWVGRAELERAIGGPLP